MSMFINPANVLNGDQKAGSATVKCNQNCDGCLCDKKNDSYFQLIIEKIGTSKLTGVSLDYKIRDIHDKTIIKSITNKESGKGILHKLSDIENKHYLLIGKEEDDWQLNTFERDLTKEEICQLLSLS